MVFKLDVNGAETVLHNFAGKTDGNYPLSGVTIDRTGNLYGSATSGGDTTCNPPLGCGTILKLSPKELVEKCSDVYCGMVQRMSIRRHAWAPAVIYSGTHR